MDKKYYKQDNIIGVINTDIKGEIVSENQDDYEKYYVIGRMKSKKSPHIDFLDYVVYEHEIDTNHTPT